jgi:hypothetical protein
MDKEHSPLKQSRRCVVCSGLKRVTTDTAGLHWICRRLGHLAEAEAEATMPAQGIRPVQTFSGQQRARRTLQ